MIVRVVRILLSWGPMRRLFWHQWYRTLTRKQQSSDITFLNYGYVILDDAGNGPSLDEEHESQRRWIQLYHHVASGADLTGREVLEVGSGRGGGAAYLHQYLKPVKILGIDMAQEAVDFCNRVHGGDGLSYRQGDAENLPLNDASFDVVVNVESSHCYGSMPKFLGEVFRVLRPGGYFCYADIRGIDSVETLKQELAESGLILLMEENIAPNVMAALRLDNEMKREYIRQVAPRWLWNPLDTFAGVEGSKIWNGLNSGQIVYHHALMQKPAV